MPQMAPLMWMNLMMTLTLMTLLMNSLIHFTNIKSIDYKPSSVKTLNWKW